MKLSGHGQKSRDCKYCGEQIYFSVVGTPINASIRTRHTCEGYRESKNFRFMGREDLSEEELFQYETAVNA